MLTGGVFTKTVLTVGVVGVLGGGGCAVAPIFLTHDQNVAFALVSCTFCVP